MDDTVTFVSVDQTSESILRPAGDDVHGPYAAMRDAIQRLGEEIETLVEGQFARSARAVVSLGEALAPEREREREREPEPVCEGGIRLWQRLRDAATLPERDNRMVMFDVLVRASFRLRFWLRFQWSDYARVVRVFRRGASPRVLGCVQYDGVFLRERQSIEPVEQDAIDAVLSDVEGCLREYASIPLSGFPWLPSAIAGIPTRELRWRVEGEESDESEA